MGDDDSYSDDIDRSTVSLLDALMPETLLAVPPSAAPVGVELRRWTEAAAATIENALFRDWDYGTHLDRPPLDHTIWLLAVEGLVEAGAGADASPEALVQLARTTPIVDRDEDLDQFDGPRMAAAFSSATESWRSLGITDESSAITPLGVWGLPRALRLACGAKAGQLDADVQRAVLERALQSWMHFESKWGRADYVEISRVLPVMVDQPLTTSLLFSDAWQRFLEQMHREMAGTPEAAHPAYLLAARAEASDDIDAHERWISAALEADPNHRAALAAAAAIAGDRGNAREARRLLWRARVEADDLDLALYQRFCTAPKSGPSRNARCGCGSGRKYKSCCGADARHPPPQRAPWLLHKLFQFAERPAHLLTLLSWESRCADPEAGDHLLWTDLRDGAQQLAMDLALWDGELLDAFLVSRAKLLPDDEQALARRWRETRRSAYEVISGGTADRATARDLVTGDAVDLRDLPDGVRPGRLFLGRALPVAGVAVSSMWLGLPPLSERRRERLRTALSSDDPEALITWYAETRAGLDPTTAVEALQKRSA